MHALVDQLETSLTSGQYFLSLYVALTIPDIAGAMSSENGRATGAKYADWFETWVQPRMMETVLAAVPQEQHQYIRPMDHPLSGEACYQFRCSLLHQSSTQHPGSPYARIIFIEPGATTNVVHYGRLNDALCIDLNLFCREMIEAARIWLDAASQDETYAKNQERFIRRHETGIAPYVAGVPVVG